MSEPLTPYAGTSGWSGSDTSRERVEREDADGTTARRQSETLSWLGTARHLGMTVKEVSQRKDWHHGQASSALSVLHKEGRIARLKERRDRCAVYVLPEYVYGRETAPHGRKRPTVDPLADEEKGALAQVLMRLETTEDLGTSLACVEPTALRTIVRALENRS